NTTLFDTINKAASFSKVDLTKPTAGKTLILSDIAAGTYTVTYYITNVNGGRTETKSIEILVKNPIIIEFSTEALKSLWKVSVSSNQEGDGGGGPALIDGDPNSFWHTPW